jgi:glutamate racemase
MAEKYKPIAIFDSGFGGLTAVRELRRIDPTADILYLGDTARVPYGVKSADVIRRYADEAVAWLTKQHVAAIIVACGTVSSVALPALKSSVPILGVVEPAARAAAKATRSGKIGVAATPATIRSGVYAPAIARYNADAEIISRACPLFVPIVESGRTSPNDPVAKVVVADQLSELKAAGADTLLLGCTHYPLLSDAISAYMGADVTLINSGAEAALALSDLPLPDGGATRGGTLHCFVTDAPEDFNQYSEVFLGDLVPDSVNKIWLV